MEENPYKAPLPGVQKSDGPRSDGRRGCLLLSLVGCSLVFASLNAVGATNYAIVAMSHHYPIVLILLRVIGGGVAALFSLTAAWFGWKRRWQIGIVLLACGLASLEVAMWLTHRLRY